MSNAPDQPSDSTPNEELSLRSLSEAFAEALARQRGVEQATGESSADPGEEGRAGDETEPEAQDSGPVVSEPTDEPPEPSELDEEDACPISPRTILEAMLFVGDPENRPLEAERAASLMRGVEADDVQDLVAELNQWYERTGCLYRIGREDAGYRFKLDDSANRIRQRFYGRIREARLSQAAIDVLAIVAYRQPINSEEVSRLRGKTSHHILSQLVRRRLLCIERSGENPRKPVYRTTDRFLELFELRSLADLPESEVFEAG